MARKKVINELNLNKQQEFERLSGHLKVVGEVKKTMVEPKLPIESPPWDVEKTEEPVLEPEQLEEKIRSVELSPELAKPIILGNVHLIRQLGNMPLGYKTAITRIDANGRTYFMYGDKEMYFDQSEKGRLFIIDNEK